MMLNFVVIIATHMHYYLGNVIKHTGPGNKNKELYPMTTNPAYDDFRCKEETLYESVF